jgi:ribonucleoside-diphosphate reductase alpha chain
MAVEPFLVRINLTRDNQFDDFTIQTFKDRYLVPGETSPQHAFARACAAFADDAAHAQRLYDYVSQGWFMFATPLLSNGGTKRGLPISCFLSTAEDSRAGIFDHWTETGWLSSVGGGVGGYWGDLRSNGEKTSQGSSSTGAIPFIATVDRLILAVSQGGTRRGSYAAYLDIDHPEIEEFMVMRKATGGDENRKGTNLHNAVCITDKFMQAVRDDQPFDLLDPKSKQSVKTVQARDLWRLLMETRKQTGEPYLFFVDTANRALPEPQKKKGLRVRQSNLCVAPNTEVLTSKGYLPIGALAGQKVDVWNGQAWSEVTVEQTNQPGEKAELLRVWFEDGSHLDVTPYHKFYDQSGHEIRAGALKAGTILERVAHPVTIPENAEHVSLDLAYTAGYASFVGFEDKNRLSVFASTALNTDVVKRLMTQSIDAHDDVVAEGFYIRFESKTVPAGRAPLRWTADARFAWFAGAMDAAGEWVDLGEEGRFLSIATTDPQMVQEMRLAALEAGLNPRIRITDIGSGFMLNESDAHKLISKNLILRHTSTWNSGLSMTPLPTVADVHPLPWKSDTFCFTEPQRGRGVFNGVLTGNCTEITLPTGRDDQGNKRTAVCCLSSVNAEKFDDWANEPQFIPDLMRMLDNCLEVFIQDAPPALAYAVYSAKMERSVGLGLLGFHAYLQRKMVAFESSYARVINRGLFEHVRLQADNASLILGAERGEAPDMAGTGERFAHKLAVAPNASSSILCGNTSPSIEPWRSNAYLHKTLSGSFAVKNPYLVRELEKYGLNTSEVWKQIIGNEGSVQELGTLVREPGKAAVYTFTDCFPGEDGPEIDAVEWEHLRLVFKTFTELDMRWVIQHGVDRQPSIDQAQSVNLAFPHDADAGYISEVHYLAWEGGLKSLYYYRSTTPKRAENTNSKVERKHVAEFVEPPALNSLSANALDDVACPACEG